MLKALRTELVHNVILSYTKHTIYQRMWRKGLYFPISMSYLCLNFCSWDLVTSDVKGDFWERFFCPQFSTSPSWITVCFISSFCCCVESQFDICSLVCFSTQISVWHLFCDKPFYEWKVFFFCFGPRQPCCTVLFHAKWGIQLIYCIHSAFSLETLNTNSFPCSKLLIASALFLLFLTPFFPTIFFVMNIY